jgi:hypothetical protein
MMATIVGVHGIAQQRKGPEVLRAEWEPPVRDGVTLAGGALTAGGLACAFYAYLFRPPGSVRGAGDEHFTPSDVTEDEAELLFALLSEAARSEPGRIPPAGADLRASTPGSVQYALRLLSRSRFFAGIAQRALIGNLKQVTRYLREPETRKAGREAVDAVVTQDTRILIGHSLGSVVAYEALHAYAGNPRWANITTFVTLGSPLGIPNLIFDKLQPQPSGGKGRWPPGIKRWTNISDDGDIVALTKKLVPLFGSDLVDMRIDNGATAHDVSPYLTARETGEAILHGLA